ncbi:hypothetical protein JMJ35_010440 [Cladonia borealis]|uniref:TRIP4/RQT4 C2HC5-type zinc finger domain-containing protein n=1 Tax=Cladonia borealis TaxID=184061 RepID=A0AA39UXJ4_9LECA|nr:hypothetical protein JMJ35_010440 [Cladonia borealis]
MTSSNWALSQLSQLLPLDEDSIEQVLDYTSTLPKEAAAEHLKDILGDSAKALEFISSYNSRREAPAPANPTSDPPKPARKPRQKKPPLNKLPPPRRPEDYGNTAGAYMKKDENDYMAGSRRSHPGPALSKTVALSEQPDARQLPRGSSTKLSKPPPSAAGPLISDLPNVHTGSHNTSRTSSPAPKTKINVPGGASMHGASTTLEDLDSAIRTLELQTNPSLSNSSPAARRCTCLATRHPLLAAAPNCLNCGKIICVKEGIGPCTFCGHPLLTSSQITSMIDSLRQERGQEKMNLNNASHRRADLASQPRPFTNPNPTPAPSSSNTPDNTLSLAKQHRDKLLAYQAENARRTHIIDQAADFEPPTSGQSMWSSPIERAAQLKRQQKVLREQEWNAKPEYEKRKVVVSVDLVGGKVVRRMGTVEKPRGEGEGEEDREAGIENDGNDAEGSGRGGGGGAFSKNPLMGGLIRPVWKGKGTAEGEGDEDKENQPRKNTWRRVQDDDDDNEAWILDGGVYGGNDAERRLGDEEHAFG